MDTKLSSTVGPYAQYATCECGSGIPVQTVEIAGNGVTLIALPIFFERLFRAGMVSEEDTITKLMDQVQIYNPIPLGAEAAYRAMLSREYAIYCAAQETTIMDSESVS